MSLGPSSVAKQRKRQRELDALAKRDRQLRQAQLLDEYAKARYRKDLAHMWATARQMSGKALGPKKRCYRKPVHAR